MVSADLNPGDPPPSQSTLRRHDDVAFVASVRREARSGVARAGGHEFRGLRECAWAARIDAAKGATELARRAPSGQEDEARLPHGVDRVSAKVQQRGRGERCAGPGRGRAASDACVDHRLPGGRSNV